MSFSQNGERTPHEKDAKGDNKKRNDPLPKGASSPEMSETIREWANAISLAISSRASAEFRRGAASQTDGAQAAAPRSNGGNGSGTYRIGRSGENEGREERGEGSESQDTGITPESSDRNSAKPAGTMAGYGSADLSAGGKGQHELARSENQHGAEQSVDFRRKDDESYGRLPEEEEGQEKKKAGSSRSGAVSRRRDDPAKEKRSDGDYKKLQDQGQGSSSGAGPRGAQSPGERWHIIEDYEGKERAEDSSDPKSDRRVGVATSPGKRSARNSQRVRVSADDFPRFTMEQQIALVNQLVTKVLGQFGSATKATMQVNKDREDAASMAGNLLAAITQAKAILDPNDVIFRSPADMQSVIGEFVGLSSAAHKMGILGDSVANINPDIDEIPWHKLGKIFKLKATDL